MRMRYIIPLALITLMIATFMISGDAERASRLDAAYRDAAFSGATRELVIWMLAFGLGGFALYLTLTRR